MGNSRKLWLLDTAHWKQGFCEDTKGQEGNQAELVSSVPGIGVMSTHVPGLTHKLLIIPNKLTETRQSRFWMERCKGAWEHFLGTGNQSLEDRVGEGFAFVQLRFYTQRELVRVLAGYSWHSLK